MDNKKFKFCNADCIHLMQYMIKENVKVDLILTDPPYELDMNGGYKSSFSEASKKLKKSIDFISNSFDYKTAFNLFLQIQDIPNMLIFCSNKQISKFMHFFESKALKTTLLVWHKYNAIPLSYNNHISDLEFIVYVRGNGAYWNNETPTEYKSKCYKAPMTTNKIHPAQKRIDHLSQYLHLHSKENDLIFDPFAGSFSCARACLNLNRRFIGCEIDKEIFNNAKTEFDRIYKEFQIDKQTSLF